MSMETSALASDPIEMSYSEAIKDALDIALKSD